MTTLGGRPHTALVVLDTQVGIMAGTHERDTVVARIEGLVEKARRQAAPVVWVQHSDERTPRGGDAWQIVPELKPGFEEPLVEKHYADAFEESAFEAVLAELGVGRLLVAGAQTDECVRATLHGAIVRGYDVVLIADAHTTEDQSAWGAPPPPQVIAHTNMYWSYHRAPGRIAGTLVAQEADFSAGA
jgi:nicotinamidase-related amidase